MDATPVETRGRPAGFTPRFASMTRCECAGMGFGEFRERMRREGLSVADACRRTGCGQMCTACLPDLETYLSAGG